MKYLLLFFYPPLLPSTEHVYSLTEQRKREREKGFDRAFEISSYRPIRLAIPLLLLDIALRHVDTNRRDVHSMDVPISRFTRRLRIRFISIPFSILSPISNWYFMLSRCANKLEMVFQLLAKI